MNPTEQAHFFLRNARYADFFKLMQLNEIGNIELATLRMEFLQEKQSILFPQRLETFLSSLEVALTKILPTEEMTTIARILSKFSFHTGEFTGREQELQDLHASLQKNLPTVLVNGLGGIGKTRLAKEYIRRHLDKYAHVVWVEQTTSAVEAFISDATLLENLGLTFDKETEQQRFEVVLSCLKKLGGTNLLVLDNYQRPDNEEDFDVISYLLFSPNWCVLITSRESIMDFETLALDILSEEEAMTLFKQHVGKKPIDDSELRDLLKLIGYHTLMIEMLAKNYSRNILLKSIADFADKITNNQIEDQVLQRLVRPNHSNREIHLYEYLLRVFDLGKLDDKALYLLKQIAVLPAESLPIDLILLTKKDERYIYIEVLENLEQKGWISFIDYKEVQMHRLVQMLILKITEPTYQNCEILCEIIITALDYDRIRVNPMQWQWALEYGKSLLKNVNFQDALERKIILQNKLGNFYIMISDYKNSLNLLEKNLLLSENIYGKISDNYANSLNSLAVLYDNIGLYDKALPMYKEVLQINKKTIGNKDIRYIISLNNLGNLYYRTQKYNEAIVLFKKALQITIKTIGKQNEQFSIILNNLADVYNQLKQYNKSLPLHKEVLQILIQTIGKEHPNYALALGSMATWYNEQQLYNEALPLYEETLQIYVRVLGKKHYNYAITMYNIGRCFIELQQVEKGVSYIIESYQILLDTVGDLHPDTQQVGKYIKNIENKSKNNIESISVRSATTEVIEYEFDTNKQNDKINIISNETLLELQTINNKYKDIKHKDIIKILLFWAIPAGTNDLKIHKEFNLIKVSIQDKQDSIMIKEYQNIDKSEFVEYIMAYEPYILHFSGHGINNGTSGIILQNDDRNGSDVFETYQIKNSFEELIKYVNIRVVILNACYSKEQIDVIKHYIPYVIGINDKIKDDYAVAFSKGFYSQLQKDTENIEMAFIRGRITATTKGANKEQFVIYKLGVMLP